MLIPGRVERDGWLVWWSLLMADYEHGLMDVSYNEKLFASFVRFTAWVCGISIGILIFLAVFNS